MYIFLKCIIAWIYIYYYKAYIYKKEVKKYEIKIKLRVLVFFFNIFMI